MFLIRHINQIKEEGWIAVKRKLIRLPKELLPIPLIIFSVPLVLLIRLFRPLIWIRFGYVRSDIIGHSVFDPEYYLSEYEIENKKTFDFFYFQTNDYPNKQWYLMVLRTLRINHWIRYIDVANRLIPGGELHHKIAGIVRSRDLKGYIAKTKSHFSFTDEENEKGMKFLESLGMDVGFKFVCLQVRDSSYKKKYGDKRDWSYHNFRNSDIETYKEASIALAEKGYWILRMGKSVNKTFNTGQPHIFDYANSQERCDFLDIWLMANCFFCFSTGTGLDEVPLVFRKPTIYVNFIPFRDMVSFGHNISLPKHLLWTETNKRLSLTEHLNHSYIKSDEYKKKGIFVEDLTSEEINESVQEMEARLVGSWRDSDEDVLLQKKYWKTIKAWPEYKKFHGVIHQDARIGSNFLRNNPEWLK
jgi:putative glycosyltransferase (TIGR04372 family)